MAGVTSYEPIRNCLSASMWVADGFQYRSNILHRVGAKVELHAHSYDHTARIRGRMKLATIAPDGTRSESEVESGGTVFIPARWKHSFELLEAVDGIGEVLCFWPEGSDQ